jgi:general secretion pathway protein D
MGMYLMKENIVRVLGVISLLLSIQVLAQPSDGHTLNLKDADIRVFIETVSDITGKSFIVDSRVEGKVNVISKKPMNADEVYRTFESILRVSGYAAIPSGNIVKIVPEAVAKQDGDARAQGAIQGPDTLVTRIIELKHVAAAELVPILTQLVPQSGQVSVHSGSNSLLITDRVGNLSRVEAIIRRIDTASDSAIEMISLNHANAAELARTLTTLAGEDKAAAINGATQPKVFADARTNAILLSGDRSARLRLRTLISSLDTPLEGGDSTQVVYIRYAKAADLVPILEQTAATLTQQSTAKDVAKNATIQAHSETNALIISADPAVFRALQSVIRQLDVRRAQVLIEGVIAEISDEYAREIGVQWQSTNLNNQSDGTLGSGYLGGTNFQGSNGAGSILAAAVNPISVGSGLNVGYVGGAITLPGSDTPILQIGALVRALGGDGRNNILSNPSLVTLDNQETQLSVGQEVPFIQGEFTTNVANAGGGSAQAGLLGNPFRTIERKEVGLKLKVTPHINEGDSVRMDIELESSSLATGTPNGASDLITNKRTLTNTVLVPDQNMLVLGGLISSEVRETVSKVPGLSSIPLLGNLFRHRSSSALKRNLMVFLKPTILRDAATEASVSSEKYNYIRAEQLKARANPESLLRQDSQSVMPEQNWSPPKILPASNKP